MAYGLALMRSAVFGATDTSSWEAYYATQRARFAFYGMPEKELEAMMEGIIEDSRVEFPGFAYALGSTLCHFQEGMDSDDPMASAKSLAAVGQLGKRSIALWGTADTDVPYANHETLLKYVPHCELFSFPNESHMFFMKEENRAPIAKIIADFVLS